MILVDILLALTLAALFIAIITESSLQAHDLFYRARDRNAAINDLIQEEASTSINSVWYGNDRIETDLNSGDVDLEEVRAFPYSNIEDARGTPLCSVDFLHGNKPDSALITTIQLPVNQSIPLTDLQVRDGIAYVSADSTVNADPDLFIFDIHDSSAPKLLSSINTGPGISAITIAGKRIYAAARSTAAQLHVIRLDSLTSPVLEAKLKLPLPYATATAPFASSIFYDKEKIYLGTEKWDGDEFNVIDVSNPAQPAKIGGFETGTKLNAMHVRNDVAYVAGSDQYQLRLIDVSNPSNPALLNAFSPSGWERQEGEDVNSFEDSLNFGRTSGGYDIPTDPEAFAWASTSISTLANPSALNDPGGVYGIIADRAHLFLGTRQAGKEFQIFDRMLSSVSSTTYPLPASVAAMTCDDDSMYVLGYTAPVIYQITFK